MSLLLERGWVKDTIVLSPPWSSDSFQADRTSFARPEASFVFSASPQAFLVTNKPIPIFQSARTRRGKRPPKRTGSAIQWWKCSSFCKFQTASSQIPTGKDNRRNHLFSSLPFRFVSSGISASKIPENHIGSGSNRIKGPGWPDGFPSAPFRAFF